MNTDRRGANGTVAVMLATLLATVTASTLWAADPAEVAAVRKAAVESDRALRESDVDAMKRWVHADAAKLAEVAESNRYINARLGVFAAAAKRLGAEGKALHEAELKRMQRGPYADPSPQRLANATVEITGVKATLTVRLKNIPGGSAVRPFQRVDGQWKFVPHAYPDSKPTKEDAERAALRPKQIARFETLADEIANGTLASVKDVRAAVQAIEPAAKPGTGPVEAERVAAGAGSGAADGWTVVEAGNAPRTGRDAKQAGPTPFEEVWKRFGFEKLAAPILESLPGIEPTPTQSAKIDAAAAAYRKRMRTFAEQRKDELAAALAHQTKTMQAFNASGGTASVDTALQQLSRYEHLYREQLPIMRDYRTAVMAALAPEQRVQFARSLLDPHVEQRLNGVELDEAQQATAAKLYADADVVKELCGAAPTMTNLTRRADSIAQQIYDDVLTDAQRAQADRPAKK